jgi:hypothetical protein
MTATYTAFATNKDRVRFYTGDTDVNNAMNSDETINAAITEFGSYQAASIELLGSTITTLAFDPAFKADWLQVDVAETIKLLQGRQTELRRMWNIQAATTAAIYTYRKDSQQDQAPTYDGADYDYDEWYWR